MSAPELCRYFALCDRPAEGIVANPMVGDVPTCSRCAAKVGVTLEPYPTTTENPTA